MSQKSNLKKKLALTLAVASTLVASASFAATPLRVVATPSPNVFPMLLALANNPNLPVTLVPVATGGDITSKFQAGEGDVLLSMTYTAAKKVTSGAIPDLKLVDVTFWRGFFMLAPTANSVTSFSQLNGKGVLVSGPTSGGKGGGPDLIFQAAAKRAGYTVSNFDMCYTAVNTAAPLFVNQYALNTDPDCNPASTESASGSSMVEPAATGIVMNAKQAGVSISKAIDVQKLFTGYGTAWATTELPHGGVSILNSVLANADSKKEADTFLTAYNNAVNQIAASKGNLRAMKSISDTISTGITTYYGQYGLSIPSAVIMSSLQSGDLVFRSNSSVSSIKAPLNSFLTEVVGTPIPSTFY